MNAPQPVQTYDQVSLESFTSELVAAGFEPLPNTRRPSWIGPIHPALARLTDAPKMVIAIRDGWPVVFPYLFAEGLHTNHLTTHGYVCLWHEGDGSRDWEKLDGFFNRLVQWCNDAQHGWDPDGLARDAQLNFTEKSTAVATFNFKELGITPSGEWGTFHGRHQHENLISLQPGNGRPNQDLKGLWFRLDPCEVPPRNLAEVCQALDRRQARRLAREMESRRNSDILKPSGAVDLLLLVWHRDSTPHLLILGLEGAVPDTTAKALQPGPTDLETLMLRAGPDTTLLRDKTVAIVGLGALGGHIAVVLAASGIGDLRIFDGDFLLPENAVRHVAGHRATGFPKTAVIEAVVSDHAPWTNVSAFPASLIAPNDVGDAIRGTELVVDTTGGDAATQAICLTAMTQGMVVVSGALYRGGSIARVRRQGTPGDTPIFNRYPNLGYVSIPPAENGEMVQPAVGCSGPVHNAPPSTVLSAASLTAEVALDALTGRFAYPDEVVDIYRALPGEPPFDKLGRLLPAG